MDSLEGIWNKVLEQMKDIFPKTKIDLWFEPLKLVSLTDTTAVFFIDSNYKKDYINAKYSDVIKKYLDEITGLNLNIEVKFKEDKNGGTIYSSTEKDRESTDSYIERYTFDNFIVGNSNKFAHAACMAVANNPGIDNNPLFVYGPSGLGKTHLMYAIINQLSRTKPGLNIVYVKGEEFTNQLIESLKEKSPENFRNKYRKTDVLIIDDIQFIAGRVATQEEFFHTFNALYEDNKQIILTADRPAKDINPLEERLRTRFESGLLADIQAPDFELRTAILQSKAKMFGIEISSEVMNYIAENLKNNVRQLEGALKKIKAQSMLCGQSITLNLAISCISDMITASEPISVTADKIITTVSKKYGIPEEQIKSKKQTKDIALSRNVCVYIIKKLTDMSFPAIGKTFNRDYSTMIASVKAIEKRMLENKLFEMEVNEIINEINDK